MSATGTTAAGRECAAHSRAQQVHDSSPEIRREFARARTSGALIRPRPARHGRPAR